jgi:hypothetical protein
MSESIATLTLSFLCDHPDTAARVLDELEPSVTVGVFRSLPARIAAPLLTLMQPEQAANVVALLEPVLGAAMVRVMPHLDCVTVLRLVSDAHRAAVFAQLSASIERDVTKSLAYPAGTVGAWTEYSTAAFRISSTIADARRYLQRNPSRALSHVFIVGSGRCLEGALSVASLLHLAAGHVQGSAGRVRQRRGGCLQLWCRRVLLQWFERTGRGDCDFHGARHDRRRVCRSAGAYRFDPTRPGSGPGIVNNPDHGH